MASDIDRVRLGRCAHLLTERQREILSIIIWSEQRRPWFKAKMLWMARRLGISKRQLQNDILALQERLDSLEVGVDIREFVFGPRGWQETNRWRVVQVLKAMAAIVAQAAASVMRRAVTCGKGLADAPISTTVLVASPPINTHAQHAHNGYDPVPLDPCEDASLNQLGAVWEERYRQILVSLCVFPTAASKWCLLPGWMVEPAIADLRHDLWSEEGRHLLGADLWRYATRKMKAALDRVAAKIARSGFLESASC